MNGRIEELLEKLVKTQRERNELLEKQNEILVGIYLRLAPAKREEAPEEAPKPITGNAQIDAALQKQRAKQGG